MAPEVPLWGKEKRIRLGVYPDVGIKLARERRDEARRLLAEGIDPGQHRKAHKSARADAAANSFEAVVREWYSNMLPTWTPDHADKIIKRFERDVFPWIGGKPVADLNAPEVLATVRRIEARGALETAHRALQSCGQVFRPCRALNVILRAIYAAPCPRLARSIWRPSPIPLRSAPYSMQWMTSGAR